MANTRLEDLTASSGVLSTSLFYEWQSAGNEFKATAAQMQTFVLAGATTVLGGVDVAAPVAQTLSVPSVVGGTSNTAGANFTIDLSKSTGTGVGGAFRIRSTSAGSSGSSQNSYTTRFTIAGDGNITINDSLTSSFGGATFAGTIRSGTDAVAITGDSYGFPGTHNKSNGVVCWNSSGNWNGSAPDLILSRNAAGILQVGTTAANAAGSLLATTGTLSGFLKTTDAGELTIATGAVTATGTFHTVDTQADAASDDLDTINGGTDGAHLVLMAEHTDRTVVVTNAGNIILSGGASFNLDSSADTLTLIYVGALSKWVQIAATSNA